MTELTNNGGIHLSPPELELFAAQQVAGDQPIYSMPLAFRLRGTISTDALEQALAEIVRRHEALRSEIVQEGAEPRRKIQPFAGFHLSFHDRVDSERIDDALRGALSVPFRLRGELPFRADLYRIAPEDHILLIQLHHLFGDMASLSVICRELSALYSAKIKNSPIELQETTRLPDSHDAQKTSAEDLNYWQSALSGCSQSFELPLDKRRPPVPTYRGGIVLQQLPEAVFAGLAKLAREMKCSVYMVLLAGFEVLVHRYTGESCFALATPFSDRMDPSSQNRVGYLSRLLPIACKVRREQSFSEFIQNGRETCIDVFSHSNVTFREIIQHLQWTLGGPRPSIARIVFQYHPEVLDLQLTGLEVEPFPIHNGTSKFDLCVSVGGVAGIRALELEFDADIFERSSIERLGRCYQKILEEVIRNPKQTLQSLDIIPPGDQQLLEQWNETSSAYPLEASVHALFEEQVQLHPERIAIRSGSRRLTYSELNLLADNVAVNLQAAGVKANDLVGVCSKRSPELIAALLGILKAGAAFVPFDVSYPKSRLNYLFEDSTVQLLVADEYGRGIAPENIATYSIQTLMEPPKVAARVEAAGNSLSRAYIMYTSGSTGNPKGVIVPHRAVVRLVKNNDFLTVSESDVFLAFAPVSFDASTLEIWAPLLNGATLAVYPSEFESAEQFAAVLKEHNVTVLWLTSALFNILADQDIQSLSGIRQLLVGGDVLSVSHIRKALSALPETRIINGYGPTENTTFTCCFSIPRDFPADRSIPIGKPIRNTKVYILDEELRPVPVGVEGDLYAAGDGLSLGYWNKPELTAESFIRNPFQDDPVARLYRTGDRARFLTDGNIEFLGRKDAQVKIRGFRIELGEVENAFRSVSGVRDAVAAMQTMDDSSKTLVAYVIPEPGARLNGPELLKSAREMLPSHAIPSWVVFMEQFPMGATGKVDRRALPAPERPEVAAPETVVAANSVEAKILGIWQMILGVEAVGVDDSFFDLGGESLRATRAVNQLNKAFGCRLAVSSIFLAPTAREMAEFISQQPVAGNLMRN